MSGFPQLGRHRPRLTPPKPGRQAAIRRRMIARLERCEDRTLMATLFGVTAPGDLVRFDSATPPTIQATTPITGLGSGETILGIDFRPATGALYALTADASSVGRIYIINTTGGAATLASTLAADPADPTTPYTTLSGATVGVDFDPAADRLRATSATGQNLRINVATGLVTTDAMLNPGSPQVAGVAYANSVAGATATTLYDIDAGTDQLLIQDPPGDGALTLVGSLGEDTSAVVGFDIRSAGGVDFAFATLVVGGTTGLYSIDLATGAASLIGPTGSPLNALAVAPTAFTATLAGATATFVGGSANDSITLDASGGLLRHDRFSAGDSGFNSDFDFDSTVPGDQTLAAMVRSTVFVETGDGDDSVTIGSATAAASTLAASFSVAGEAGVNSLVIDDSASGVAATVVFSAAGIGGIGSEIGYSGATRFTINTGTGGDQIGIFSTVNSPLPTEIKVNAGGGNDAVSFASLGFISTLTPNASFNLDGGAGADVLTINTDGNAVMTTAATVTVGGVPIGVTAFEAIAINGAIAPAVTPKVPVGVLSGTVGTPLVNGIVTPFDTTRPGAMSSDFTATIDWGDGTTTAGLVDGLVSIPEITVPHFGVIGSHTYATAGLFTITTTVVDQGGTSTVTVGGVTTTTSFVQGPTATATASIVVSPAPVRVQATTTTVASTGANTTFAAATFTSSDPDATASQFSATADFGDNAPALAGMITQAGSTFLVTVSRVFPTMGTLTTTVTVTGGAAPVSATGQVRVVDQSVVVDTKSLFVAPGFELTAVEVARFGDFNGASPVGTYTATIDWGDGTPTTTGLVEFVANATFRVVGTHGYAAAGFYPLTVTIRTANTTASGRGNILAFVLTPPPVDPTTIGLAPESDTGASRTDGITNDTTPSFNGRAQPGSLVTVSVATGNTTFFDVIGTAVADASGSFTITSTALSDGDYSVLIATTDQSGAPVGPNGGITSSNLVVDTVGPRVSALAARANRSLSLTLTDDLAGIDLDAASDLSNYRFSRLRGATGANLISGFTPGSTAGGSFTADIRLNGGRAPSAGRYRFLMADGVSDLAGNALDGEFTGAFPTGDGTPGGGLRARFTSVHGRISGPRPVEPTASPAVAARVRDLALGEITVAQAKKKRK